MTFVSTSTREHAVARALATLGHGECGGYYDSPRGIRCRCNWLLTGQVQAALAAAANQTAEAA